jgi:LPXTG-motif cell wall-anchored protein
MRSRTPAHARPRTLLGLVSAVLLVGLTLTGSPAHAAKPDNPPGQSKAQTKAQTKAAPASSSKGQAKGQSSKSKSSKAKSSKSTKAKSTKATSAKASGHSTSGTSGTSGDPKSPQPLSNADQNSGGANGQCPGGPYCSTRDGSPSLNGNGGGEAKGKPCAGCVGKADNKNPKGQFPDGSDHNKGYECDANKGIGKTNPAHTGCKPTPPPPPPDKCPEGTTGTPPDCVPVVPPPPEECPEGTTGTPPDCENVEPPGDCPPGMTGIFPDCDSVLPPPLDNPGNPGNPGNPDQPQGSVAGPRAPTAATAAAVAPAGGLPQTGAASTLLGTGLAGLLMVLGGALVVARRRAV